MLTSLAVLPGKRQDKEQASQNAEWFSYTAQNLTQVLLLFEEVYLSLWSYQPQTVISVKIFFSS